MKNIKKLHLNIKMETPSLPLVSKFFGEVQTYVKKEVMNSEIYKKASAHNVVTQQIKHHSDSHVEMVFEGERENLWKMVRWSKDGPLFASVEEVLVHFTEPELSPNAEFAYATELVGVN